MLQPIDGQVLGGFDSDFDAVPARIPDIPHEWVRQAIKLPAAHRASYKFLCLHLRGLRAPGVLTATDATDWGFLPIWTPLLEGELNGKSFVLDRMGCRDSAGSYSLCARIYRAGWDPESGLVLPLSLRSCRRQGAEHPEWPRVVLEAATRRSLVGWTGLGRSMDRLLAPTGLLKSLACPKSHIYFARLVAALRGDYVRFEPILAARTRGDDQAAAQVVHHVGGIALDDRAANLMTMTARDHDELHRMAG